MGVFKKGRHWYIDFYVQGRRKRKKIGPSKTLAELALKDVEVKIAKGEYLGIYDERKVTFREFADEYLEWAEANTARGTAREYGYVVRACLVPFFGDIYLSSITVKQVEDYKIKRGKEAAAATVNKELRVLKAMFHKAIEWKRTTNNPSVGVKPLKTEAKEPRFLSQEEAARLLEACPPEWKALVATGLYAGLRQGELINLEWSDINLRKGTITVQNKADWQTKNRQIRVIPIAPRLRPYLVSHPRHFTSPYVFCNEDGSRLKWLNARFATIVKQAGLSDVTPHTLRHTFASWLVMTGTDLATVQKLLGHHDITMTMIYSHLAPSHLKAAVARLDFEDGHQMDTKVYGEF